MKEEFKQSEGDPNIKGRIRQLRHARMKKRMMAAVPKASVVITNPTHYAVALSYERGMSAPVCVAKGVDTIALKIREIAGQHDIPIVENVQLARALHASVEIDDEIPVEHYHAVAEIIGYVMGLKRGCPAAGRDLRNNDRKEICWKCAQPAKSRLDGLALAGPIQALRSKR